MVLIQTGGKSWQATNSQLKCPNHTKCGFACDKLHALNAVHCYMFNALLLPHTTDFSCTWYGHITSMVETGKQHANSHNSNSSDRE